MIILRLKFIKSIFFFLLMNISLAAFSQTYILLDRNWSKAAILTDSISKENLNVEL